MKNRDVILLVNVGVLSTTALDIPASDAYKLIGFKRAIRKQLDEIIAREQEIGDNQALLNEMRNEDIVLEGVKKMPYESYHALSVENRAVNVTNNEGKPIGTFAPFALCEEMLEGILWEAPEE